MAAAVVARSRGRRRRRPWWDGPAATAQAPAPAGRVLLVPLLLLVALAATAAAFCYQSRSALRALPPHGRLRAGQGLIMAVGGGSGKGRGRGRKPKAEQQQEQGGLFAMRFPWDNGGGDGGGKGTGKGRKGKKKEEADGFNLFGGLFGGGSAAAATKPEAAKKGSSKKKGGGGGGLLAGFWDFNSEWKGQISLQRRIKKLEKEVANDYVRGDRAKAAQYRYEVLKTLEEVQSTMTAAEEAVLGNEFSRRARQLEREDARVLKGERDLTGAESMVKPEDLDSLLQQMEALVRDEQQQQRLASACVGAAIGLAAFPTHDFFGVLAAALVMTFLTTRTGLVGDAARMSGYAVVSLFKALSTLEKRFEVLRRAADFLYDALEASVPFPLPWREAPSWRNAYRGEGFLHPDIRPAPPMRDAQYVEYLREVKRWVDAEERAVLTALKKKEDDRIQDALAKEERREQVQKVLSGLWDLSSTAAATIVGAAADGILRAGTSKDGVNPSDLSTPMPPPPPPPGTVWVDAAAGASVEGAEVCYGGEGEEEEEEEGTDDDDEEDMEDETMPVVVEKAPAPAATKTVEKNKGKGKETRPMRSVLTALGGSIEEDVEFLRKFNKLMRKRRVRAEGEEEDEEEQDDEEHEEDIFWDDALIVEGGSGQGGSSSSGSGGGSSSASGAAVGSMSGGGDGGGGGGFGEEGAVGVEGDLEGLPLVGGGTGGIIPVDSTGP